MAHIFINDKLRLNKQGLMVRDSDNRWTELHCQQGRLDGACVVCSVVMALLCIGYICNDDIDVNTDPNPDRRTEKGKLLSLLLDERGLVRDGYYLRTMSTLLRDKCSDLEINYHKKKETIVSKIKESVESNYPVVISVNNDKMGHGILVVGVEYDKNDNASKLLCLDPGFSITDNSYWNCIIDFSKNGIGTYPYWYITNDIKSKVDIKDIIIIADKTED